MTNEARKRQTFTDNDVCKRCDTEVENTLHAFRDCQFVMPLWRTIVLPGLISVFFTSSFEQWIHANKEYSKNRPS